MAAVKLEAVKLEDATPVQCEEPPCVPSLEDALSIYQAPFLSRDTHAWVRECHAARLAEIQHGAILVVKATHDPENVKAALRYRSPVYYGGHMMHAFDERKLLAVHGYSLEDVDEAATPQPGERRAQFAIIAPNWSPSAPEIRFHTVHAFGVNLESRETPDYSFMVGSGRLEVERYSAAVRELMQRIVGGVAGVARARGIERPVVRMPLIGLGAFLTAVGSRDKKLARQAFVSALQVVTADVVAANMTLQVLDYTGDTIEMEGSHDASDAGICILTGSKDADLFRVEPSTSLFIVNAWDDLSFIGNGGQQDPTIDGYMVAGSGPGRQLINCSYLHNAFFLPKLFDPSHWILVP